MAELNYAEANEALFPTRGNRYFYDGMYDRAATHGEPQGSGEDFNSALSEFNHKMSERAKPGKWRYPKGWKVDNGEQYDLDYYIMEWL